MKISIFYLNITPYLLTVPILTYCNLKIHWRYLQVLRQIQITMLLYLQYSSLFNYNVKSNYNILLTNHQLCKLRKKVYKKRKKNMHKMKTKTKKKQNRKNMFRYLSLDIICSPKLQFSSRYAKFSENCSLIRTDNVCRQTSVHISVPDGGYCLFIGSFWTLYQRQGLISMPGKTLIRTCFSKGIVVDHRVEKKSWKVEDQPFFLIRISNTCQQNNPNGRYKAYDLISTWMCSNLLLTINK